LLQIEPNAHVDWPKEQVAALATIATARSLQVCYQAVVNGARDLAFVPDQQIGFQMIILRMLTFQTPKETTTAVASTEQKPALVSSPALPNKENINAAQALNNINNVQQIRSSGPGLSIHEKTQTIINKTSEHNTTQPNSLLRWEEVVNVIELRGLTKVIAENCVLESAEDDHFKLHLEPNYKPLLTDKITTSIAQALSLHYNRPIQASIAIQHLTADSPAMKKKQLNEAVQNTLRQEVINNANVIALQHMLDAKLESINLVENS